MRSRRALRPPARPQLRGAGELAARYGDVWIQSHVAENLDEVAWVKQLFPQSRSYLAVYDDFGLMRERAVYAHSIWLDETDRQLMHDTLGGGHQPDQQPVPGQRLLRLHQGRPGGMLYGLASDVGGGMSFSPFRTMQAAYVVGARAMPSRA
jgi:guanine deaminase